MDRIRTEVREGTFRSTPDQSQARGELTFSQFAKLWHEGNGQHLVRARDNGYRLALIEAFVLPGSEPPMTFGQKLAIAITLGDIEAYRSARKKRQLSAVTINHDLKLLRKMFNWESGSDISNRRRSSAARSRPSASNGRSRGVGQTTTQDKIVVVSP